MESLPTCRELSAQNWDSMQWVILKSGGYMDRNNIVLEIDAEISRLQQARAPLGRYLTLGSQNRVTQSVPAFATTNLCAP